ncbi:2-oxoacid:acceptor oxidoreductase family protein [Candidatus Neomarinimicrobiota bacterium]
MSSIIDHPISEASGLDSSETDKSSTPKYPGIPITTNGNQLVSYYTEARLAEAGIFYPITPSTEMGENFQLSFAKGDLNVFGTAKIAIEAEGEHAAQGGAIAAAVTGKRVVNFTSGQGLLYGLEQYYHAPGKFATVVVEVAARALTKHALNVHCGHDDVYATMDTGWTILFGKDAQQAADQAVILRRVNELSLNPGINCQDGFLTSHLERTSCMHESELLREFLGRPDDLIACPTSAQRELFGPMRRRVPEMIDLKNPLLLGPVQNQEHYMNGIAARRNNFSEDILGFLEDSYAEFGRLTGRNYGLISQYNCDDADTVMVSVGSSAENIEAASDYLTKTRGEKLGVIHMNVIRPFPEKAIVEAIRGKKHVIVLERSDEQLAGNGPLARDIRTALSKALENNTVSAHAEVPSITVAEMPRIFNGIYGLGSRDFRPEGIIGAYDFVQGHVSRTDGRKSNDGTSFFYVGIDHPYAVISEETPSLLPDNAIAVRFHSIGGWGMITTGKNMGEILGAMDEYLQTRGREAGQTDEVGQLHISANPKYGSEKKGAPTSYFLSMARERIRVNCDLKHVDVVLSADPKIFTHSNPLEGIKPGGAFVWENANQETAWERIPVWARKEIVDKGIRVYLLPGFEIAREATNREDLQLRMQGNAFLGAFFKVSTFLADNAIPADTFKKIVKAQYEKKFGRFGDEVVASNMLVMQAGFDQVNLLTAGDINASDRSSMRGPVVRPLENGNISNGVNNEKAPVFSAAMFDNEFRAGLGYHQPASPLASVGMVASGTGANASKYGARRQVPVWIAENCTQCMSCITACPDTALPNTAQEIGTVLKSAINSYVDVADIRQKLIANITEIEAKIRARMNELLEAKDLDTPFAEIVLATLEDLEKADSTLNHGALDKLKSTLPAIPMAYARTNALYKVMEKKEAGSGALFGIFVSDLCKGCGECVEECGDKDALRMVEETEELNGEHLSAVAFLDTLPDTPAKYLGKFDPDNPQDSIPAALQNHLMVRRNYEALVAGDGACAGCGEKSVLRSVSTLTESLMRPRFHAKADRLDEKAKALEADGTKLLKTLSNNDPDSYLLLKRTVAHTLMGLGREEGREVDEAIAERGITDEQLVEALVVILRQDAFNHRDLQALDGRLANGMAVMAMTAHTGCNSVYGSTPPNNPHPYPWMNSLFQDGVTIGWILGESFIASHGQRSVIPERLADKILSSDSMSEVDYFDYTHFTDTLMTDLEVRELPKVWAIGGDGGMGDIGFQNVSKAILQNRPNVQVLMLDTQVYSNTGGQNSDSSVMTGGFDMNQFGAASQGKLTEKKSVAEILTVGHGSPYVASVSMANAANLYKAIVEGLEYRGTAFIQSYTPCQPEHGINDSASAQQAALARDARGVPEFSFDPTLGELSSEAYSLKGNPSNNRDWYQKTIYKTRDKYSFTVAHWALNEARFRRHIKKISADAAAKLINLDDMLLRLGQQDVVHRNFLRPEHRSYIPDWGVHLVDYGTDGTPTYHSMSRHMVLFCVERRKAWRNLQDRAGIVNEDYLRHKQVLAAYDKGEVTQEEFTGDLKGLVDSVDRSSIGLV